MKAVIDKAVSGGFSGEGLSPVDARKKGQLEADKMIEAPSPPADPNEMLLWENTLSADALADIRGAHPDVDKRYTRLHNQVDAFETVYGRAPESSTDWIMADALDPTSYLEKNDGVDANIALGKIDPKPGQGIVRLNMYIPADEVYNLEGNPKDWSDGHIRPKNLGDNRGASKSATAEESRVSIFVDYENGLIVGRQNPSVETSGYDETEAGTPEITARQGEDGLVRVEYMASDPFQPQLATAANIGVKGDLTIEPRGEQRAEIGGNITNYPSVEAYQYRPNGDVDEIYNYGAADDAKGPGFNLWRGDYKTLPDEVPSVGDNPELTVLPDGQVTIVPPNHPGVLLTPSEPVEVPHVPTTGR